MCIRDSYYTEEGIDLTIGEGQGSVRAVQTVGAKGDDFGLSDGGSVVAAVIRDEEAAPALGTVSAAAPLVRLPPERIAELARAVRETAAELSVLWPLGDARRADRATARQERRSM